MPMLPLLVIRVCGVCRWIFVVSVFALVHLVLDPFIVVVVIFNGADP
jgi:hypothetical protein